MGRFGITPTKVLIGIVALGVLLFAAAISTTKEEVERTTKAVAMAKEVTKHIPLTEVCVNGYTFVRSGCAVVQKLEASGLPAQCLSPGRLE